VCAHDHKTVIKKDIVSIALGLGVLVVGMGWPYPLALIPLAPLAIAQFCDLYWDSYEGRFDFGPSE
jgi:hypothetical protein